MKHKRFIRVRRGKGSAREVYRINKHTKPTRFRFKGIVKHKGKKMRQRLGFRGDKVVEIGFVPIRKRR